MIAAEAIYIDREGNIVAENDPNVAFQLVGKGTEIPAAIIDKYGEKLSETPEKAPRGKKKVETSA